jgi:hypothetical protein
MSFGAGLKHRQTKVDINLNTEINQVKNSSIDLNSSGRQVENINNTILNNSKYILFISRHTKKIKSYLPN